MKAWLFSLFWILCGLCGPQAFASPRDLPMQERLVVIGYADENHLLSLHDLVSHRHFPGTSKKIVLKIGEELELQDFSQDPLQPHRWLQAREKRAVTVLDANVLCPGENNVQTVRGLVCAEQIQRSERLKDYLETNLKNFDEFIYIGHSRLGLGLGLGPFYGDRFTFQPVFYNPLEAGRLKKVLIASCDSEKYYARNITQKTAIQFKGTVGAKLWIQELLPMILKELHTTQND